MNLRDTYRLWKELRAAPAAARTRAPWRMALKIRRTLRKAAPPEGVAE